MILNEEGPGIFMTDFLPVTDICTYPSTKQTHVSALLHITHHPAVFSTLQQMTIILMSSFHLVYCQLISSIPDATIIVSHCMHSLNVIEPDSLHIVSCNLTKRTPGRKHKRTYYQTYSFPERKKPPNQSEMLTIDEVILLVLMKKCYHKIIRPEQ